MGGVLSQPNTDKSYNQGDGLGLRYGLCSMQGWRTEMEDAHDVKIGLRYGLEDWSYFAVFDGHAGKRASAYAAWNLLEFILRDNQLKLQTANLPGHVPIEPVIEKQARGETQVSSNEQQKPAEANEISQRDKSDRKQFGSTLAAENKSEIELSSDDISKNNGDQAEKSSSQNNTNETNIINDSVPKPEFISLPVAEQLVSVKEAIRSGFLRIDESMRESDDLSGCTAVCVLISPTHLFIANCGDSRAVLFNGTEATFATEDHKPLNPKERQRIIRAGGSIGQRINGTLAVSRALGDFEFKKAQDRGPCEQLVSPEPEVTVIERGPKDEFLILACDGIWDVMGNLELCEYVRYRLRVDPSVQSVCSTVLDLCLSRGSRDNMSIIIVVFENGPQFDEECRAAEEKSDEALIELARSSCEQNTEFQDFIDRLEYTIDKEKSDPKIGTIKLPPPFGLMAKYDMLHKIFMEETKTCHDETTNQ